MATSALGTPIPGRKVVVGSPYKVSVLTIQKQLNTLGKAPAGKDQQSDFQRHLDTAP